MCIVCVFVKLTRRFRTTNPRNDPTIIFCRERERRELVQCVYIQYRTERS